MGHHGLILWLDECQVLMNCRVCHHQNILKEHIMSFHSINQLNTWKQYDRKYCSELIRDSYPLQSSPGNGGVSSWIMLWTLGPKLQNEVSSPLDSVNIRDNHQFIGCSTAD